MRKATHSITQHDMRRRFTRLALGTLALSTLMLAMLSTSPHARAANTITLGAYIDDAGLNAPCDAAAMDAYSNLVGRMPAIIMWYQTWSGYPVGKEYWGDFPTRCMDNAFARGATVMTTWEPWAGAVTDPTYKLSNIVRGDFDSYIRRYAQGAKAWGHPFLLRFAHEMNGNWYPWGTMAGAPNRNSPSDYVAAWRHVHDIFDQVGASNVRWVWSPNVMGYVGDTPSPSYASLYPGDAYVDWVGIDGYNDGGSRPWRSFPDLFSSSYTALTSLTGKPLVIAETASGENGGDKAGWIAQSLLNDIPSQFPAVRAVVWFDKNKETDWRVNSSSTALTTYRRVVSSSLYQGQLQLQDGNSIPSPSATPPLTTSIPTSTPTDLPTATSIAVSTPTTTVVVADRSTRVAASTPTLMPAYVPTAAPTHTSTVTSMAAGTAGNSPTSTPTDTATTIARSTATAISPLASATRPPTTQAGLPTSTSTVSPVLRPGHRRSPRPHHPSGRHLAPSERHARNYRRTSGGSLASSQRHILKHGQRRYGLITQALLGAATLSPREFEYYNTRVNH